MAACHQFTQKLDSRGPIGPGDQAPALGHGSKYLQQIEIRLPHRRLEPIVPDLAITRRKAPRIISNNLAARLTPK